MTTCQVYFTTKLWSLKAERLTGLVFMEMSDVKGVYLLLEMECLIVSKRGL